MISLIMIILSFLYSSPTLFRNRLFTIGFNSYSKLCSNEDYFSSSSEKRIENYPEESDGERKEILEIASSNYNSFFQSVDGKIYASGYEPYSGTGSSIRDNIIIPVEIAFPFETSEKVIGHMFPLYYGVIFCTSSFGECFGFGYNYYGSFLGCETAFQNYIDPTTIFTGILSNNTKTIETIFTGNRNTIILFREDELPNSSKYSLYGTGCNQFGILSVGFASGADSSYATGWNEMNTSSIFGDQNETIKFAALLFSYTFLVVTESNRWFFSGRSRYSGCMNLFGSDSYVLTLTEMPQNGSCGVDSTHLNEVLGKNINDLQCGYYFCIALTNESKFYTWGDNSLGRTLTYPYTAREVNSTRLNQLKLSNHIKIERIYIQYRYTFITIMDHTEKRKRIFGYGYDYYNKFDFPESSEEFMLEVFAQYNFTSSLILSKGTMNTGSIFLLDSLTCWGKYPNDSTVACQNGYCYDYDQCKCDEGYTGTYCSIPYCFGILANESAACNGNGNCTSYDTCNCILKQEGVSENCTYPICFGKRADDSEVCNSHGKCYSDDNCACDDETSGENCENKNKAQLGLILGVSIGSFSAVLGTIFIISLCFFGFIICCVLIFLIPIFFFYLQTRKKMKTFQSIKNIDLIMEEQQLEERMDIAHLKINKQLFQIEMKDIRLKKILGEGGSNSIVYLVLWHNKDAAFKCFKTRTICNEQQNFNEFEKEVEILGSLSHPNIIRYFGACLDPSRTGFVMEYCSNGDLGYYMTSKKRKQEVFDLTEKIRMLLEIASAMSFLHSKKIIHRDLKPENVLLDSTLTCKLMDFGASKFYEQTKGSSNMTKGIGTSYFMSPEIALGRSYSNKVDVFSFGILMFVLLTEEANPYHSEDQKTKSTNIEYQVANNPSFRPKFKEDKELIPSNFQNLCRSCWKHDAQQRPSFEEICGFYLEKKDEIDTEEVMIRKMMFLHQNKEGEVISKKRIPKKDFIVLKNLNEGIRKKIQNMENKLREKKEDIKKENERLRNENESQKKETEEMKKIIEQRKE